MPKVFKTTERKHTVREIYDKRKRILINRQVGGLGDIMMHRMIFEDFKILMPDVHITFACPMIYHPAVIDHPFIDEVVDTKTVSEDDFVVKYRTTDICSRYELRMAPTCDKHRSDIWAEHCGVTLTKHNMHIRTSQEEKDWAKNKLAEMNPNGLPSVMIAPISAMLSKNMEKHQIQPVIDELTCRGYYVFTIHSLPIFEIDAPCLYGISTRHWLSMIEEVDYVIGVDTSTYHCRAGMNKPVVGIFGWADGKVYSKYSEKYILVQRHRDYTPGWNCGPCYNFTKCPKCPDDQLRKPCITELTWKDIMAGFEEMITKYPVGE
jgi:ADP-heptose:LPS heptosyltransferase